MAINWRPGQDLVMAYRGGRLAVPAVPGAGKTHVLAHLAADLIATGAVGQGKILIVTAMNSAVSNFRQRISRILAEKGIEGKRKFEVRTLHSLAVQILQEKTEVVLVNKDFNIIDEEQRKHILKGIINDWMRKQRQRWEGPLGNQPDLRQLEKWREQVADFLLAGISTLKGRGVQEPQAADWIGTLPPDNPLGWLLEVYLVYQRQLSREGGIDFDDMILKARDLLRLDQQLRQRLSQKWKYIFEDEAQDSNPLQEEILRLLSSSHGNLVRVGDSNQAIMGTFTAAEPELYRAYCRDPLVQKVDLLYASRSCQQVIDTANWLVRWVTEEYPVAACRNALEAQFIQPAPAGDSRPNPVVGGFPVVMCTYRNGEEEYQGVTRYIALAQKTYPGESIAVLVPTREIGAKMAETLAQEGIAARIVGEDLGSDLKRAMYGLVRGLKYLGSPDDLKAWIELWQDFFALELEPGDRETLLTFLQGYRPEELLYPPGQQQTLELLDALQSQEAYTVLQQGLRQVRDWLEASLRLVPDQLVLYLAEDLELKKEELALAHNLAGNIRYQLQLYPEWRLKEIASNLPVLEPALKKFALKVEEMMDSIDEKSVTICTCHKAKGLEWDIVFVIATNAYPYTGKLHHYSRSEYKLPGRIINLNAEAKAYLKQLQGMAITGNPLEEAKLEEIREKLRLFYVAITRAKKRLIITRAREYQDKNGKPRDSEAPTFWKEMVNFVRVAGGKIYE